MTTQFLGVEAVETLRATNPAYRLREIDQTAPAGMWQVDAQGADLLFQYATAADWSAFSTVVTMTSTPSVTIHGTIAFSGTVVFEANVRLDDDIVVLYGDGSDYYMGYSATDDQLEIGSGSAIGSNVVLGVTASDVAITGDLTVTAGTDPAITAKSTGGGAVETALRLYNPHGSGYRTRMDFATDSGGTETVTSRIEAGEGFYFDITTSMTRALSIESDGNAAINNGGLAIEADAADIITNSKLHIAGGATGPQISQGDFANQAGVLRQVIHKQNVATGAATNVFYIRTANNDPSSAGAFSCRLHAVVKTPGAADGGAGDDVGTMGHSVMWAYEQDGSRSATATALIDESTTAYAGPTTQTIDSVALTLAVQTGQVLCQYAVGYSGTDADDTFDIDVVVELTYTTFTDPPMIDVL